MKKKTLVIALIFISCYVVAQEYTELCGIMQSGGENGMGCIFKTDGSGNNQEIDYSFGENPMNTPHHTHFCEALNGKLYGMTGTGGSFDKGVLFEFDPVTSTYTKLIDFEGITNGSFPYGSLIQTLDGKLYGMTNSGGIYDMGVLFEFDPSTSIYTKKIDFDGGTYGSYPFGSLLLASNGRLYGLTSEGGSNNDGVMFEFDPTTDICNKKLDFNIYIYGRRPGGSLMQASNGRLYGMTYGGGSSDMGVLFEYDIETSTYIKRINFNGSLNGKNPYGHIIQASNGKLYGMTGLGGISGGGVLFEYDPSTTVFIKKVDFEASTSGCYLYGSLMQASNGKLYAMTYSGGCNSEGVLFEFDITTSTYTKKIDFERISTGSHPSGSLMQASNGELYGMTSSGGIGGRGVLFEFDINTDTYTKKLDFAERVDGCNPSRSLLQASNGKLYGVTSIGGSSFSGVLFEFDQITSTLIKKFDFDSDITGRNPVGPLIQATNGKLYGMTYSGGIYDMGVLFEFDLITSTYTKKMDFDGSATGGHPNGALMQASNGNLYGMTFDGGSNNMGVMFEFDPATNSYTKILDFDGSSNGGYPIGSLIQASNGKLYGVTRIGGSSFMGVLFEFDPPTSTFVKKFDFIGITNGSNPIGSLIQGNNGKLYGTSYQGGDYNYGVLYEFDPISEIYTKEIDFDGSTNGRNPGGTLLQASNGKFYGMTYGGGSSDMGVLFEYDYNSFIYTKKLDFDGHNGRHSFSSSLIEICAIPEFELNPINSNLCSSNDATFVVSATGNNLTYQWQIYDGSSFINIFDDDQYIGAQNDTLNLLSVQPLMNGNTYRCIISSDCPVVSVFTDTLVLSVNPVCAFTENQAICEGETYNWQGSDYTETNTYTANYLSENGCDSIYTLNLTVNPLPIVSITGLEAQYCDNITAVQLTGNPTGGVFSGPGVSGTEFNPSVAGVGSWEITYTYSDVNECENSISQMVQVDDCSVISNEITSSVLIYPNPNSGDFTISLNESGECNLAIYNSLGQIVWLQNTNMSDQKEYFVSGLVPGTYILKLVSEEKTDVLKIVIR